MNKKLHLLLLLALISAIGLNACGGQAATPAEAVKIRFAYDYWAGYYPALIAIDQGYFAEEGIQVEAIKPEKTDALMADFLAGKYDMMAVSLGDIITLTQNSDDFAMVLSSDESAGGDAVVVNPSIKTIADLRGKQIGTNLGGFGELFITTVLNKNGISPSDVILVNMDASEGPAKLASGELQAAHTWEPYVSQAVAAGNTILFTSADTPGLIPDGVVVRGAFLRDHPAAVQAFVKGWFRAVDFWLANPKDGNAAAAKQLKINPDEISLDGIKLQTLADNLAMFTKPDDPTYIFNTAQLYVDFFLRNGSLTKKPDIAKIINPSFLK